MSLATVLYNYHGIIMCADKLVNATTTDSTYHCSFTEQKLFLIEGKYGLSYTGTASVDNIPLSALLEEYFIQNKIEDKDPAEWLLQLATYFHNKLTESQNIVFIFCGYYNNKKFILNTNTIQPNVNSTNKEYGLTYSGETNFLKCIIETDAIAFDYIKLTIQDAINFLRFLNETVANMMYYGQYLQTVSKECDILVIKSNDIHLV